MFMNELLSASGMNPSGRILCAEWGVGDGMELRIGIGRIDSGLLDGAGTGTGTGVRVDGGREVRLMERTDMGVTTVGTGRVGAWSAVSYVLLRERFLDSVKVSIHGRRIDVNRV